MILISLAAQLEVQSAFAARPASEKRFHNTQRRRFWAGTLGFGDQAVSWAPHREGEGNLVGDKGIDGCRLG